MFCAVDVVEGARRLHHLRRLEALASGPSVRLKKKIRARQIRRRLRQYAWDMLGVLLAGMAIGFIASHI